MRHQTRRELRQRRLQARVIIDWFAIAFVAGCFMFFGLAVYLIQAL